MENVSRYGKLSLNIFDIIFKYGLDRIIKHLDPVGMIKGLDCQILGGCDAVSSAEKLKKALDKILKWLPGGEKLALEVVRIFMKKCSITRKIQELLAFIKVREAREASIRKRWIGWDNVDYGEKKITLTLTMYSKPEHAVRATYRMTGASVTMGEIGEALKVAFDKKKD